MFIILAFIGFESFYKGTNSEQRPLSTYKQSQLQRKVPGRYDGNESNENGHGKMKETLKVYRNSGTDQVSARKLM